MRGGAGGELRWAGLFLDHLARINRFDLTLDFADKATVATLTALANTLESEAAQADGVEATTVASIRRAYKL